MKFTLEAPTEENHENVMAWDVFTGIWRKFILVILSEENHENLKVLEGGCVHWHLKKAYISNLFWGKSRWGVFVNWC
jgi:hypothetical protein